MGGVLCRRLAVSIEEQRHGARPGGAGAMAVRSETGQALANAVDQPVEAGRVVGVYALALDRLRRLCCKNREA